MAKSKTRGIETVVRAIANWCIKQSWKRLFNCLALLAAITFALNGEMANCEESQLESRLALIRAAGDPASIADLAPAAVPNDDNAAVILERMGPKLSEFSNDHARFFNTPVGQSYEEGQDRGEPATPEQIFEIRLILIKYQDLDEAIAEAAKCDRYASQLDYSLGFTSLVDAAIATQRNGRMAARFAHWRMEVLIADGFHEDALENGIEIFRLALLYESEPTIVPFLVGIAMRNLTVPHIYDALDSGPVSDELHAALDRELALVDTPRRLEHALKTERAVSADWLKEQLRWNFLFPPACQSVLRSEQWGLLDEIDAHLQLAAIPWHEARSKLAPSNSIVPPSKHGKLADSLLPGLQAIFHANARDLAVARSLRVYNALQQFAEKHGREATGLAELDLPAAATIDPYSGKQLKLKHTHEGWVVYSVMENGVDDGGDFLGRKDYGVAPRKLRLTE
jgi:hypothetical protein